MLIFVLNLVNGNWGKCYLFLLIVFYDNGELWLLLLDLESDYGEYFYFVIISEGGVVYIIYMWNWKNIVYC